MISFRRGKNLRDLLVKSSLRDNNTTMVTGTLQCGRIFISYLHLYWAFFNLLVFNFIRTICHSPILFVCCVCKTKLPLYLHLLLVLTFRTYQ